MTASTSLSCFCHHYAPLPPAYNHSFDPFLWAVVGLINCRISRNRDPRKEVKQNRWKRKESAERDNNKNLKAANNRERQVLQELMMDPNPQSVFVRLKRQRGNWPTEMWRMCMLLGRIRIQVPECKIQMRCRSRTTEAARQQRLGFYCSVRLPVGRLVKQTQREEFAVPGTQYGIATFAPGRIAKIPDDLEPMVTMAD